MPFGFGRKSERPDLIEVTLVDATSGRRFGSTDLPLDQLPESFELSTTMHLGEDDWRVERADPIHRAGYVASGRLTLVLRKADKIDPSKILFSLPTLEDALPPMREPDSSAPYEIHEDDWRQREFVSRQFTPEIDTELAEIRRVWGERNGPGFQRAYVRAKVRAPLRDVGLTLDVREALGGIEELGLAVTVSSSTALRFRFRAARPTAEWQMGWLKLWDCTATLSQAVCGGSRTGAPSSLSTGFERRWTED